jgi:site-specific recombinase XerD
MECKVLGKGNKERVVYIDNITMMYLKWYFAGRKDDSIALFAGRGSSRMTPGGVRAMLVKIGNKAGINNVHPHRFRRTLATNLINRGMSIQEVAVILGHDKIDTTLKYVYINQENVKIAYRKYS